MNVKQYDSKSRINKELAMSVLFLFALLFLIPLSQQAAATEISPESRRRATDQLFMALMAHDPIIERIIHHIHEGADVNAVNENGMTPLMVTATKPMLSIFDRTLNPDILRILIENGADVNTVDEDGKTSLMSAISSFKMYSNPKSLLVLIEHGTDLGIKDKKGKRAFDYAEENMELARYFRSHLYDYFSGGRVGGDVNLKLYHPWDWAARPPRLDSPAYFR